MNLYRARSTLSALCLRLPVENVALWLEEQVERIPIQRSRWWLVQRPGIVDQGTSVCYEDAQGLWWEYDPDTRMLHDTPWLITAYRNGRDDPYRYSRLMPREAKLWMSRELGGDRDDALLAARSGDKRALDPIKVLGVIEDGR